MVMTAPTRTGCRRRQEGRGRTAGPRRRSCSVGGQANPTWKTKLAWQGIWRQAIEARVAANQMTKAIAAAIGTTATAVSGVLAENVLGTGEIGSIASALAAAVVTVYSVWRVPNRAD